MRRCRIEGLLGSLKHVHRHGMALCVCTQRSLCRWLSSVVSWRGDGVCVVACAGRAVVCIVTDSVCARFAHACAAEALAPYRHAHALAPQVLRPEDAAGARGEEQSKAAARSGPAESLPCRGAIRKRGDRCRAGDRPARDRWLLRSTRGRAAASARRGM